MLVQKAARFAEYVHRKQRRKFGDEPYFNHLVRVATTLAQAGYAEDIVAAGYLHDTIEDQEVPFELLESLFGFNVANIVDQVTDRSRPEDGNRKARKEIDRVHLTKADWRGQAVKLADLIDNSVSIVAKDPGFAVTYMAEKRAILDSVPWSYHVAELLAVAWNIMTEYSYASDNDAYMEDLASYVESVGE